MENDLAKDRGAESAVLWRRQNQLGVQTDLWSCTLCVIKTGTERRIWRNAGLRINIRSRQQVTGALQNKEFCPKSYIQSEWWWPGLWNRRVSPCFGPLFWPSRLWRCIVRWSVEVYSVYPTSRLNVTTKKTAIWKLKFILDVRNHTVHQCSVFINDTKQFSVSKIEYVVTG